MAPATILIIAAVGAKNDSLVTNLSRRYHVLHATSGRQGVDHARHHKPRVIVLDAISLRTTGERICRMLNENLPQMPIIHLHPGPREQASSPAEVLLLPPFTSRKVVNNIERLLQSHDDTIITCGDFSLNMSTRMLVAHGRETQLTPKVAELLAIFLRHRGETLDRRMLMEKIWQTDYMGDTRTLDVHIRWIRQLVEDGRGKPRYLQTVRGVGYRFDLPEA